jgi:hypothetical protein
MRLLSVSYTLPKVGQKYELVMGVLWHCSVKIAWLDESQIIIATPYAEARIEQLLRAVIDSNDNFSILTIAASRHWNKTIAWQAGGEATTATQIESRKILRNLFASTVRHQPSNSFGSWRPA